MFFYLKKRSNHTEDEHSIYARLTLNGERVEISTGRKCEPAKWNPKKERKNGTREDAKILNAYLDTLQFRIYEIYRQAVESDIEFNIII